MTMDQRPLKGAWGMTALLLVVMGVAFLLDNMGLAAALQSYCDDFARTRRSCAVLMARCVASTAKKRLPRFAAATAVVPDPLKKSATKSPWLDEA